MTGVFLLTRSIPAHEREIDGVIASGAVTQTDMIKTVTGDRYFAVSTADQAQKADTDKPATADQKAPTYTKDTIPQVTGLCRLSEKADSLKIGWDEIDGVQGYRIYRRDDNDPQADYKLFSVVNRAGLDIRNLSKGSKYIHHKLTRIAASVSHRTSLTAPRPMRASLPRSPSAPLRPTSRASK